MIKIGNVRKEHTLKEKYSQFKNCPEQNYTDLPFAHFMSGAIKLSCAAYFLPLSLMERGIMYMKVFC